MLPPLHIGHRCLHGQPNDTQSLIWIFAPQQPYSMAAPIAAMDTKILIQHQFFNVDKSSTHPMKPKIYEGIHNQEQAMTPTANIIRDAWVFGIIPEDETCEGWTIQGIDALYDKVTAAWQPYGHLVSNLPPELRERHARIYAEAIERARATGWDPELDETD